MCKINSSRKSFSATVGLTVTVLVTGIILTWTFESGFTNFLAAYPQGSNVGNSTFGTISSIQYNEEGDPFWIVTGHWKTNLLNLVNQTGEAPAMEIFQRQHHLTHQ